MFKFDSSTGYIAPLCKLWLVSLSKQLFGFSSNVQTSLTDTETWDFSNSVALNAEAYMIYT